MAGGASEGDALSEMLVIGRVVHYLSHGSPDGQYSQECRPALVTSIVGPIDVTLAVFNPTGMFFNNSRHADPAD